MDAFEILVIILSTTLAVFLVIAIIAGILLIQVLKRLKRVSESAVFVAENVQQLTGSVGRLISGSMLMSFIDKTIRKVKK